MDDKQNCPVCGEVFCDRDNWSGKASGPDFEYRYRCARCGDFILADALKYGPLNGLTSCRRSILSQRLRRMQRDKAPPQITNSILPKVSDRLPAPAEQADNLILWVGDHQTSSAQHIEISDLEVSAWIGTEISPNIQDEGLAWLLRQKEVKRLVENNASQSGPNRLLLTFEGWQRYEELKHKMVESRKAFMAMKFGDGELDRVVDECFKPAVVRTGFELRILTEAQPAGLIDDQMRVALRTSRFVIADLTHCNNGAYWEAGFAEGLGRPVIYTCRKSEWEKTHFDTNHLAAIIWEPENFLDAERRLTAMIRATLPAEAKMTD